MKRLFSWVSLLTLSVSLLLAQPVSAASPSAALAPCSIYELKNYAEQGKSPPTGGANFTAITLFADSAGKTGGQTVWVELGPHEIQYIKALNLTSYRSWSWAVQLPGEGGSLYRALSGYSPDVRVHWLRIALASNDTGLNRNQVCVLARSPDGRYARIAGIPQSLDYAAYKDIPWLQLTSYNVYPDGHTGAMAMYRMPLFEPSSGYRISLGGDGLWIETSWLYKKLGEYNPGATPPPTPVAGTVYVPAGTVVRQSPDGVKIYKAQSSFYAFALSEIRGWIKIGYQRWIAESAVR